MSRVAKVPIMLPAEVECIVDEGTVTIKGSKGVLKQHLNKLVNVLKDSDNPNKITFEPKDDVPQGWTQAGTARALVNNMVVGVTEGCSVTLELVGVGYRAQVVDNIVTLSLGFSHPVEYILPQGVSAETPNNTTIVLRGIDNQQLGQVASKIRAFRPPEPYKGKGVKYAGETIVRKEAKKK